MNAKNRLIVTMEACMNQFTAEELIGEFFCPHCQQKTCAVKSYQFENFPSVFAINVKRFVFDEWIPRKLGIQIQVPDVWDLSKFQAKQATNEQLLPDETKPSFQFNQVTLSQLMEMGFPKVRAERALHATQNADADTAMNWLLQHMEDPDIDKPLDLISKSGAKAKPAVQVSEENIQNLTFMGFSATFAKRALIETDNNVERAVEWLFSHSEDASAMEDQPASTSKNVQESGKQDAVGPLDIRPPIYELFAFITHIGTSVHSGHYIAHIKKGGRWVLFNDQRVEATLVPPSGNAYIYFFKKVGEDEQPIAMNE